MKKLPDVCLLIAFSVILSATHIDVQLNAQDRPAVHRQSSLVQGKDIDQAQESSEKPNDPLGRSTPHGTVFGFLQTAQHGDFKQASQYLQLSNNERLTRGEKLSRRLHALMDNAFLGRVGAITDDVELKEIDRLSTHYLGSPYGNRTSPRVATRLHIERWHAWGSLREEQPVTVDGEAIVSALAAGEKPSAIAKRFNVARSTVYRVAAHT